MRPGNDKREEDYCDPTNGTTGQLPSMAKISRGGDICASQFRGRYILIREGAESQAQDRSAMPLIVSLHDGNVSGFQMSEQ
jgi:hypothetical protein